MALVAFRPAQGATATHSHNNAVPLCQDTLNAVWLQVAVWDVSITYSSFPDQKAHCERVGPQSVCSGQSHWMDS